MILTGPTALQQLSYRLTAKTIHKTQSSYFFDTISEMKTGTLESEADLKGLLPQIFYCKYV